MQLLFETAFVYSLFQFFGVFYNMIYIAAIFVGLMVIKFDASPIRMPTLETILTQAD